ncbi:EAL domain-containing protein [Vibrio ostreicida]|uniref:EAL domain-containing protein n=1 Tax=Vibrio ostreicida TaxID=526588 RepID=A0ABT8BPP9_9VIBR|nr:EAL domain-containing protein [Vibrio ostreicida]MDN3609122.1 EAL domain-containing protein [Vibrio ostreicida]
MLSQQLQHWFSKITANSPFFFAILDSQHNYVMVNGRYCDIAGLSTQNLIGMNDPQILGQHFYHHLRPYYERAFKGESLEAEITLNDIDQQTKTVFSQTLSQDLTQGALICLTGPRCGFERRVKLQADDTLIFGARSQLVLIQDADESSQLPHQKSLEDIHIDSLTGIHSRFGFTKRLEHFIESDTPLLLLYLDIDNFKNINDSLGHHIGDKVIKEVSSRLKRLMPSHAVVGHLGGDEFGLILPNPDNNRMAEVLAERIISLINQPFDLQHFSKRLSCSIGSVIYPDDGSDARLLLQNADTAMYEAKDRGRNRLIKFNDQMNKEARMRLWLEIELQKALQQNGLEVWYQPKVNARDFSINGAEALIRWKHPVEGYISPSAFIPVAERAGLIEHLGRVVMREVFSTVKRWKLQGILLGRVAINLSPEQFGNPKLIDYMEKLLRATELDPNCITFELTESAVMSDSEHTLQMLRAIKKLGFALSIDDFGTGYSSLSYLARFPIDELKIDRAFISDIDTLPKQITVIENIINLGKSLNLTVVAEGVETQQQATLLSNLNCHSIQGFHFFRPQPKQEVEELFTQHRRHKN